MNESMRPTSRGVKSTRSRLALTAAAIASRSWTKPRARLRQRETRQLRMMKCFIDIRVGIEHLADKLEPVKLDTPPVPVSDDTIVHVMLQRQSKLTKLFDAAASLPEQELDRPITAARSDSGDTGGTRGHQDCACCGASEVVNESFCTFIERMSSW